MWTTAHAGKSDRAKDLRIAAKSRRVAIRFSAAPEPLVAIVDDGDGMDESTLLSAMRLGSRDPRLPSTGVDLGRFGLGLKTASLSQCRRLTVVSCSTGNLAIARGTSMSVNAVEPGGLIDQKLHRCQQTSSIY
jgi:hypothetical protein